MSDPCTAYQLISRLCDRIGTGLSPGDFHRTVHHLLADILPVSAVEAFVVAVHEPITNMVRFAYFSDSRADRPANRLLSEQNGLSDWVILNRKGRLWYADVPDTLRPPQSPVLARYAVPLLHGDTAFGALIVESYTPGFRYSSEDMALLDHAAADISILYRINEQIRTNAALLNGPGMPFMTCRIQDGRLIDVNQRTVDTLGYRREDMIGSSFLGYFALEEHDAMIRRYHRHLQGHDDDTHYFTNLRRRDGSSVPVEVNIMLDDYRDGRPAIIAVCVDTSEVQRIQRESAEHKLRLDRARSEDGLTGLLNQMAFKRSVDGALQSIEGACDGDADSQTVVVVLDLDDFKSVNWFQGTDAGDRLLILVAERLRACFRQGDLIARLAGNRFAVFVERLGTPEAVGEKTKRLLSQVALPYPIGDRALVITASAGVAVWPEHGGSGAELVNSAEAAMLMAKRYRNRHAIATSAIISECRSGLSFQEEIRQALVRKEFQAWYQPKFNREGAIVGAEALARWQSPNHGLVLPARFIDSLERMGLIGELWRQMTEQACAVARAVQEQGQTDFSIAVNISPRQFEDPGFHEALLDLAARSGLAPRTLELEITESGIVHSDNLNRSALAVIERAHDRGMIVSIDDFGTGTSSLSRLRALACHVDKIKIDKTFVDEITHDAGAYLCAIINLVRSLESPDRPLTFIIEGVETAEQAKVLHSPPFDGYLLEFQGFHFGQPMPAEEFRALLP